MSANSSARRLQGAAVSVTLVVVATILGLVAGEVLVRLKNADMRTYDIEMWRYANELKLPSSDPELGHEHRRNAAALLQSVTIRTNDHGLRGGPVEPLPAGGRRVLVLGASITLGWGVPEEQTFTVLLQDRLAAAGETVQVLNAGIGNYNAARYTRLFLTRLHELRPTDIVVHYFLRDAERLEAGGGSWLLRNSELAMTLWIAWNRLWTRLDGDSLVRHYQEAYRTDAPGYQEMQRALGELAAYARRHDIRTYLAIVPDVHSLENYPLGFAHRQVAAVAETLGYRTIDLLPAFGRLRPAEIWAMPGDPHPNALGHRLMADAVFPLLHDSP
jgi:lysophospholipase L1-like esterase